MVELTQIEILTFFDFPNIELKSNKIIISIHNIRLIYMFWNDKMDRIMRNHN